MRAEFHDAAGCQHGDLVGVADGGYAVGDEDCRAARIMRRSSPRICSSV